MEVQVLSCPPKRKGVMAENQASTKVPSAPKPPEYIEEIIQKTSLKRTESPQAYIIIVISYMDDLLTKMLKKNLVVPNDDRSDSLFDDSRPLYHFGPKIDLSYRMGMISPELLWTLHKLRKLRDRCAHSQVKMSFSDGHIRDVIDEMHARFNDDNHKGDTIEDKFQDIVSSVLIILWSQYKNLKSDKSAKHKEGLFR